MSLLPISRLIARSALTLGGTKILWYRATPCSGRRDDGTPCFDEESGSAWIDCPVCQGVGARYLKAQWIHCVYTDKTNEFEPDGSGGFVRGKKSLSVSPDLHISLLKMNHSSLTLEDGKIAPRILLRDKFVRINPLDGKVQEVLYLESEPNVPVINGGQIYQILNVMSNG